MVVNGRGRMVVNGRGRDRMVVNGRGRDRMVVNGRCRDRMVVGFTKSVSVESVPITTEVASSNPALGEVYSIYHNVIKFISYSGFLHQ